MTDTLLLHKGFLKRAGCRAIDLIYPVRCPVCDDAAPRGETICLSCMKSLKALKYPWCEKCGKKLNSGTGICGDCQKTKHRFERCRSVFEYPCVRDAVYRFKYLGRREYAYFFAESSVKILGDYLAMVRPDIITAVPLSAEKMLKRGYNQAGDYASELSKRTNIPFCPDAIKRIRNTAPMKLLSPAERQKNLKNAFKSVQNVVKSKRILLIDDIYTTGATMDECASVLLEAGAESVYCMTLASGAGI
ncbi:MAG: ComF family protein [Lachnospiraceae bacterium]|nr:ComF family protein [Lachnospiraceae bacterium]